MSSCTWNGSFYYLYCAQVMLAVISFIHNTIVQWKYMLLSPHYDHRVYKNIPTFLSCIHGKIYGTHYLPMPFLMGLCSFLWYHYCGLLSHHFPHEFSNKMIAKYNSFLIFCTCTHFKSIEVEKNCIWTHTMHVLYHKDNNYLYYVHIINEYLP